MGSLIAGIAIGIGACVLTVVVLGVLVVRAWLRDGGMLG